MKNFNRTKKYFAHNEYLVEHSFYFDDCLMNSDEFNFVMDKVMSVVLMETNFCKITEAQLPRIQANLKRELTNLNNTDLAGIKYTYVLTEDSYRLSIRSFLEDNKRTTYIHLYVI